MRVSYIENNQETIRLILDEYPDEYLVEMTRKHHDFQLQMFHPHLLRGIYSDWISPSACDSFDIEILVQIQMLYILTNRIATRGAK